MVMMSPVVRLKSSDVSLIMASFWISSPITIDLPRSIEVVNRLLASSVIFKLATLSSPTRLMINCCNVPLPVPPAPYSQKIRSRGSLVMQALNIWITRSYISLSLSNSSLSHFVGFQPFISGSVASGL